MLTQPSCFFISQKFSMVRLSGYSSSDISKCPLILSALSLPMLVICQLLHIFVLLIRI